jgi:DNA polymerase V
MISIFNFDKPVLASSLPLEGNLIVGFARAGFPSPTEDLGDKRINLIQLLVKHSQATYFLGASGHSVTEAGIFDNDILVVDRAIKPHTTHIVVSIVDGDFTVKQLHQRAGRIKLKSANLHTWALPKNMVKPSRPGAWSRAPSNSSTCEGGKWCTPKLMATTFMCLVITSSGLVRTACQ